MWRNRLPGRPLCDNEGRDWSYIIASQGTPKISGKSVEERKINFPTDFGRNMTPPIP